MHWPKIQHHLKNITAKDIPHDPRLLYDMRTSRSRYTLKLTESHVVQRSTCMTEI